MKLERAALFIESLEADLSETLEKIEDYANVHRVPVLRPQSRPILRYLLAQVRPRAILEVGTAIGFSALYMREYTPSQTRIDTIEKFEPYVVMAKENFKTADPTGRITLYEGDATDVLKTLNKSYELIFMDAAKGQYIHFLPEVIRLLSPGGVLLSDNCLQEGDVLESRYAVIRRDRTIHARMREYLYEITHHPMLSTCILPIGDGMALSTKGLRDI
jgi:predicted O-methyltransferase YrrM